MAVRLKVRGEAWTAGRGQQIGLKFHLLFASRKEMVPQQDGWERDHRPHPTLHPEDDLRLNPFLSKVL